MPLSVLSTSRNTYGRRLSGAAQTDPWANLTRGHLPKDRRTFLASTEDRTSRPALILYRCRAGFHPVTPLTLYRALFVATFDAGTSVYLTVMPSCAFALERPVVELSQFSFLVFG